MLFDIDTQRQLGMKRIATKLETREKQKEGEHKTPWEAGYETSGYDSENDMATRTPSKWEDKVQTTKSRSSEILSMAINDIRWTYTETRRSERKERRRSRHYDEQTYISQDPSVEKHIRKGKALEMLVKHLQSRCLESRDRVLQIHLLSLNRVCEGAWNEVEHLTTEDDHSDSEEEEDCAGNAENDSSLQNGISKLKGLQYLACHGSLF